MADDITKLREAPLREAVPPASIPQHLLQSDVAAQVKPIIQAGQEAARQEQAALRQQQQLRLQVEQQLHAAKDDLFTGCLWWGLGGLFVGAGLGLLEKRRAK